MSGILGNAVPGAGGSGYTIDNSLRFRNSASAYLSRTPVSAGSRTTWTMSFWIKLGNTAVNATAGGLFVTNNSTTSFDQFCFSGSVFEWIVVNGSTGRLNSTQVFRDPGSWYHIVATYDSTNATASDRMRIYLNGSRITAFGTATYPAQNTQSTWNNNVVSGIGVNNNGGPYSQYFDGYMSEINFVDGQALTSASFGETNSSTGVWQPKKYTGSYGTNGFYLKFSDIATTSGSNAGLGKDFSGNTNYWNTNNISVTSGVTYDAMTDSPTPKSATVANFCVLNPLDKYANDSLSNANLTWTANTTATSANRVTIGMSSGKWYCEYTVGTANSTTVGIVTAAANSGNYIGSGSGDGYGYWGYTISYKIANGGTTSAYGGGAWSAGDIIGIYFDADAGSIGFTRNGTDYGNAYTGIAANTWFFAVGHNGTAGSTGSFNFGQRSFAYTPPTGYKRLNSYNLPTPTIGASSTTLANKYFDISLYTGNGSTQTITNSGSMQPDMVWVKSRSNAYNNVINDAVRGSTKLLITNGTDAEQTETQSITSFNSNGFSLGTAGTWNQNGSTFVGWQWRASNATAVTNTAGSITSTVSANTTSGFSIVTYTGTGATATVGHGLGVAPSMIIIKNRSVVGNWPTYHASLGNTVGVYLNLTNGAGTTDGFWNNTSPTSTVFTVKDLAASNGSGNSIVAYCFAEKTGFSKFGLYTGNGSSDGPFVYCGFRPKYVITKRTDSTGNWYIQDTSRSTYNLQKATLFSDSVNAEAADGGLDFLSNGFKLRNTDASENASGGTYIYMAFAENPFNYSLAR